MAASRGITYTELLRDAYHSQKNIDPREISQLLRQTSDISPHLLPIKGFIHIIDYTRRRHLALSSSFRNLMGYRPDEICESGLEYVVEKVFHKDDFKVYNEVMFKKASDLLRNTPQREHKEFIFGYSFRLKNADGKWINVLQQGRYVTDPETKLPLYAIALVQDITALKKDGCMIFSIDKKDNQNSFGYKNIITEFHYSNPGKAQLSKREREITILIANGLISKQIADKLHLSENTVVNHRKNILKKTNAKNVAELITYCMKHGII